MKEIKVGLFGVGGYGGNYPATISKPQREGVKLVGAVDPYCKKCDMCPVYDTAEELFANHELDLVIVSTPIHCHVPQAVTAFEHGCHVALEKPIAADMAGGEKILAARDKAGKALSVGFHWCADPAVRAVKEDLDAGLFGKPLSLKGIVLWPRAHQYYFGHHGGWGGKRYSANGEPIFDNVLSNATAHYLMNILFMLGEKLEQVECATFKGYEIETFDTAVVKGKTAAGVPAFIAVTHAAGPDTIQHPMFCYEFENATVTYGYREHDKRGDCFRATFKDGTVKEYGLVGQGFMENFWNLIDVIRGEDEVMCSGEIAALHVDVMEKMRNLQSEATVFPQKWICQKGDYLCVNGLAEAMYHCYDTCTLPNWDMEADQLEAK